LKILIINSLYPPIPGSSGAEKATSLLGEALVRRGHKVVVVSLHPEAQEITEVRNGVKVYRIPISNIYWIVSRNRESVWLRWIWHVRDRWNRTAAARVGRILDAEKPDVVNTHNICGFSASVWREVKRRKIRLVHTTHDYYVVCSRRTLYRDDKACSRRCVDCALLAERRIRESKHVDVLVSVSRKTLELHRDSGAFNGVPSHVVFNLSGQFDRQNLPAASQSRDQLVFGFIGVFEPKKGLEILLRATEKVRHKNWRLDIAGYGEASYEEQLRGIRSDPRICWLGFTSAQEFLAGINVVVIPSLWPEPLPYVCMEALQAGKGMICADSGGIPEMCHLASRVIVVPPGDVGALANAMDNALGEPAKWRDAEEVDPAKLKLFGEEEVLEKYLAIYSAEPYQKVIPDVAGRNVPRP